MKIGNSEISDKVLIFLVAAVVAGIAAVAGNENIAIGAFLAAMIISNLV